MIIAIKIMLIINSFALFIASINKFKKIKENKKLIDENKLLNKQYEHCILRLVKERNINSEIIRSLKEDLIELRTSTYDFALDDHKFKEEKNKLEKEYEKKIQKRVFNDFEIRELLNKIFKILQISEIFYRSKCNVERIELILDIIDSRLGEGSKTWFKNYTELYNENKLLKEEIKNIKKRWWE